MDLDHAEAQSPCLSAFGQVEIYPFCIRIASCFLAPILKTQNPAGMQRRCSTLRGIQRHPAVGESGFSAFPAILSKDRSEAEFERMPPAAEPRGGSPREFAFRLGNDLRPAERVRKDHDRRVSITLSAWERFGTSLRSVNWTTERCCLNCLSAWERFGTCIALAFTTLGLY